MNLEEISLKIDSQEKELKTLLDDQNRVEQERFSLQRQILELQLSKKDMDIAVGKATHNVRKATIELNSLKRAFWNCRNS